MTVVAVSFPLVPLATLLWGLLGVGVVVVGLYLLRLRRRRVVVAFLPLWEKSLLERRASALRSRLQRLLSLLLSLLLVGALVLALGDPRADGEEEKGKVSALLIDVSASMAAPQGDGSRLDAAKRLAKERISGLGAGDRLLVIEIGAAPRPLGALTSDRTLLEAAVDSLEVLDVPANVEGALGMARDALRAHSDASVLIVSDGALSPVKAELRGALPKIFFQSVVEKETSTEAEVPNIGITAFSARRYPLSADRFEVLVEVENAGKVPVTVDLLLHEASDAGLVGAQLDQNRLTLAPGEVRAQSYENLDRAEQGLIATVARVDGQKDGFPPDDVARTLLSPRAPARILVVGPTNNFLDAALLVDDSLVVKRVPLSAYPPEGAFDVTIFDGVFPKRAKATGAALYLGAPPVDDPSAALVPTPALARLDMFGFDTWKKDSVVFRLVDPYDIQVLTGHSLAARDGDLVLGASGGRPILVSGERPEGRFLALGFSPNKSDFVLRTAFPLFVLNAIDELFPRGRADATVGLKTGTLWRPSVALETGLGKVKGPLGAPGSDTSQVVPIEDGRAVFFGQRAGFYDIETAEGKARFAASVLRSPEASLGAAPSWSPWGEPLARPPAVTPRADRKPWFWLLAVVLFVSFIEWWTFHRRWTV